MTLIFWIVRAIKGSIKPQTTNISNISHGTVTIAEQSPDNSNLDSNVVREINQYYYYL